MKSVSGKELCKIVEQRGWILQRITGSHASTKIMILIEYFKFQFIKIKI